MSNKIDANDIGREKGSDGLAGELDRITDAASPISPPTNTTIATDDGGGEWEEPTPLSTAFSVPPFPRGIFPTWLEPFVAATQDALEVPYDLPASVAIGALATVFQKKFALRLNEGWIETLSMFCIPALEPGSGKSPCFSAFMKPITDFERENYLQVESEVREGERKRNALLRRISSLEGKLANDSKTYSQKDLDEAYTALDALEIPSLPLMFTSDATPESIGKLLVENAGRMTVASAEGAFLEILLGRYSDSPAIEIALSSHNGEPVKIHRASKDKAPIILHSPALSLILCVQPHLLQSLAANTTLAGRGFLSRCFISVPVSTLGYREHGTPPVPSKIATNYYDNIHRLLQLPISKSKDCREIQTQEIPVSESVFTELIAFKRKLEPQLRPEGDLRDTAGFLSGWAGKAGGLALRVAGLLALSEGRSRVEIEHFKRGITVTEYEGEHAKAVAGMIGSGPAVADAKRILDWLIRNRRVEFSRRLISQNLRGLNAEALTKPLDILIAHNLIRAVDKPRTGAGRTPIGPSLFIVNPQIFKKS